MEELVIYVYIYISVFIGRTIRSWALNYVHGDTVSIKIGVVDVLEL